VSFLFGGGISWRCAFVEDFGGVLLVYSFL
jgi:hypothetical protein